MVTPFTEVSRVQEEFLLGCWVVGYRLATWHLRDVIAAVRAIS